MGKMALEGSENVLLTCILQNNIFNNSEEMQNM